MSSGSKDLRPSNSSARFGDVLSRVRLLSGAHSWPPRGWIQDTLVGESVGLKGCFIHVCSLLHRLWPISSLFEADFLSMVIAFHRFSIDFPLCLLLSTARRVIPDLKRGYDTAGANRDDQNKLGAQAFKPKSSLKRLLEMSQEVRMQEAPSLTSHQSDV